MSCRSTNCATAQRHKLQAVHTCTAVPNNRPLAKQSVALERKTDRRRPGVCLGVRDIADKLQESRLRWFGHVKRRPPDYVGNVVSNLEIPGVRPRGRPKTRWTDVVRKDLQSCNVSEEDTSDRAKWRRKTRKADPTIRWE
ncbi:hypothetical protein ACJJTC_012569 [Scirpophaga incertulas]